MGDDVLFSDRDGFEIRTFLLPRGVRVDVDKYIVEKHGLVLDDIRKHLKELESMDPVYELDGTEFQNNPEDTRKLKPKVKDYFKNIGGKVWRRELGYIELNNAGVNDSLEHGYGPIKAACFASLPSVIEKGLMFGPNKYMERGYDTYFFAAPVKFSTSQKGEFYVGVYVIKDVNTTRYKIHEVLTVNKKGNRPLKPEADLNGEHLRGDFLSDAKVTQPDPEVKKNSNEAESFSDRNVTPTSNREILLNATEDATQTDWEKKLLQRYKDKAKEIADVEERLDHTKQLIKELSSDIKYKSKVMTLRADKISMESQLRKLNNELRNMMELKPLQDLLKREKQRVLRTAQQRYKNRLYEQKLSAEVKQSELLREHRETKAAMRQQQSDYAIMEDEFFRIVKAYEKMEKAAEKSAAKAAQLPDLRQTLKEEAKKYREDSKTWDAEFRRLLREYEKSGRKINELEQKRTEMRHQIRRDVKDIYKLYNRGKDANNVKEEMQEFVFHALSSAELLLDDLYTDDDMICNGNGY